jgi:hypothetical protein
MLLSGCNVNVAKQHTLDSLEQVPFTLPVTCALSVALHSGDWAENVIFLPFLQTIFFGKLTYGETQKLAERLINYILFKVSMLQQ